MPLFSFLFALLTLKDYLFGLGVLEHGTPEEIENAKKDYRKQYQQTYQKNYRKKQRRTEITWKAGEYALLHEGANLHNMRFSSFVKKAALSYLQNSYIEKHPQDIHALQMEIRAIGNQLNQITRKVNSTNSVSKQDLLSTIHLVNQVEQKTISFLREPPNAILVLGKEFSLTIDQRKRLGTFLRNINPEAP